jgi:hypothetical protein
MLADDHGPGHVLKYLEQRQVSGGLDLIFTIDPSNADARFWQCVENELQRRGLSNAECFGDGSVHRITLTVEPSAYAASVDELEAAVADAGRDYSERVMPAHRAALAAAAEAKARQEREAEHIDLKLRRRFPGLPLQ